MLGNLFFFSELNSQEQVAPLPISGTANVENRVGFHNFDVPSATVIPYAPKGFSISIPGTFLRRK